MKICFPIANDNGLESPVFSHFGSAPAFILADSETKEHKVITNNDRHHDHGMCHPLRALSNESPDAIVVNGIGMGALIKLNAAGIRVYLASEQTVSENLMAYQSGSLREATPQTACGHHGHSPSCGPHGQQEKDRSQGA